MVGLSDLGLYQRTILTFNGQWQDAQSGTFGAEQKQQLQVTVALDLEQGLWVLRGDNWQYGRSTFLGGMSGRAYKKYTDIHLETPKGDVVISKYFMNDAPRRDGPVFRGPVSAGGQYAYRSYWWRHDDPSIMTPFDRMAEMLDRAIRSVKLRARLREQFGDMISPEALLPMVGLLVAMFGAEFVGGAAVAITLGRLLGVHQMLCDYYFYEPRAKELHRICMGAATVKDLEYGADTLVEILCQLISDIATAVGITALTKIASRLFALLMTAVPERVRFMLKDNAHTAAAYIRGKGYKRRDLLRDPAGTPLEHAAVEMYKHTSAEKREILVVREPDAQRSIWVNSHLHHNSKPCFLKARSADGWHGLVCLKKAEVSGSLKSSGTFDVNGLKGFHPGLDAEHGPARLPMYDMPLDGREMGPGVDYHYTGNKHVELQGHKLVDLGDRYLIVDAMGRPYISDLDLATRQRPGLSEAGAHLPKPAKGPVEDNIVLQYEMNELYHKYGGNISHNPNNHGGGGATVVYTIEGIKAGKIPGQDGFWTPKTANGYKAERLVIFVPEWQGGRIVSNMYVLDSWESFRDFAGANNLQFPF